MLFDGALGDLGLPPADSSRGIAVAEVLLVRGDDSSSSVLVRGRLSNGLDYSFELSPGSLVGKKVFIYSNLP